MRVALAIISFSAFISLAANTASAENSMRLTVTQWVRPAETGELTARVVVPLTDGGVMTVTNAKVVLLGNDGRMHEGRTNELGEVKLSGVIPGIYAMIASGHKAIACYAMHVLDPELVVEDMYPATFDIAAANLDFPMFESLTYPYLAPEYERESLSIDNVQFAELVDHVRGNEAYRVTQFGDGFRGRICRGAARGSELVDAEMMNVFLLKDGIRIGQRVTDFEGMFEFQEVGPGIYSLITVGPHGLGVVGFELKTPNEATLGSRHQRVSAEGHRFVTNVNGPAEFDFELQVIPVRPSELTIIENRLVEEEVIIEDIVISEIVPMDGFGVPISGGGYVPGSGGGGYGGGGFGGGGGGGAGFAGLAAFAGIGAAVAASSSDGGTNQPASPSVPQ